MTKNHPITRLLISALILGLGLVLTWLVASGAAALEDPPAPDGGAQMLAGGYTPIVSDVHTVWLDHLDGTTIGEPMGPVAYVDSLPGLELAADLITATSILYTDTPDLASAGTVEFWVNPRASYQVVRMDLEAYKPTGPIDRSYQLAIQADQTIQYTSGPTDNQPAESLATTSTIPFNAWTHVALSWGPAGTKIYLNGERDIMTTTTIAPSFGPPSFTNFTYLNYGGKKELGSVDEFHISDVQRSDAEIRARVTCSLLAVNDAYSTTASSTLVVPVPGVLENDLLFGAEAVTVSLVVEPSAGTLNLALDGSFVYTPAWPSEVVTFTYEAGGGDLGASSADVTITVIPRRTYLPLVLLQ